MGGHAPIFSWILPKARVMDHGLPWLSLFFFFFPSHLQGRVPRAALPIATREGGALGGRGAISARPVSSGIVRQMALPRGRAACQTMAPGPEISALSREKLLITPQLSSILSDWFAANLAPGLESATVIGCIPSAEVKLQLRRRAVSWTRRISMGPLLNGKAPGITPGGYPDIADLLMARDLGGVNYHIPKKRLCISSNPPKLYLCT
jgi:hypothetical protein